MNHELYTRLGLPPDATPPQIRRAYRKAAKTAHPDAGGSPEQWASIVEAYETLNDPRRRRIYDDTGTVEPGAADNHYAQRLIHLATAMDEVAAQYPQLAHVDWADSIRRVLNTRIQQCRQGVVDMGSRAREWDAVALRCTVPQGAVNVLRGLAEGKAAECRRRAGEAQDAIRQYEETLALIANATCSSPEVPAMPSLIQQMAATGQIGPRYIGRMW
jgi:curved DNA-binding protein CbpA